MSIEKTQKDKKSHLVQYLPYLGAYFIFLGLLRLIFFYRGFGISIIDYVEVSEIITALLSPIVFGAFALSYILLSQFFFHTKLDVEKSNSAIDKIIEESKFVRIIILYLNFFRDALIGGVLFVTSMIIWHFCTGNINLKEFWGAIIAYHGVILLYIILIEMKRQHILRKSSSNQRQLTQTAFYTLLFSSIIIWYAHVEVNDIKIGKTTLGTEIQFINSDQFISDSTNYYVGKTQKFIFIYHEEGKVTDVIPLSMIKKIIHKDTEN